MAQFLESARSFKVIQMSIAGPIYHLSQLQKTLVKGVLKDSKTVPM
jgi:hypothetical protein